jgi:hypothetical protein
MDDILQLVDMFLVLIGKGSGLKFWSCNLLLEAI